MRAGDRTLLVAAALLGTLAGGCRSGRSTPAETIWGAPPSCLCDHARAESLARKNCALCRVASGKSDPFFLLKDIDPGKPNRWLVLPRDHPSRGLQTLAALPPEERRALAAFAVAEAERLFPARWGIAVNGDDERTQCHLHVHLSPLRSGAACSNGGRIESDPRAVFDRIGPGGEVWVHPEGGRYHVHTAVPAENVLEP